MAGIEPRVQKLKLKGAVIEFAPIGSSYKDKTTNEKVVRTQATLKYEKAGSFVQMIQLDPSDIENFRALIDSKQIKEWLPMLPETSELEPDVIS